MWHCNKSGTWDVTSQSCRTGWPLIFCVTRYPCFCGWQWACPAWWGTSLSNAKLSGVGRRFHQTYLSLKQRRWTCSWGFIHLVLASICDETTWVTANLLLWSALLFSFGLSLLSATEISSLVPAVGVTVCGICYPAKESIAKACERRIDEWVDRTIHWHRLFF